MSSIRGTSAPPQRPRLRLFASLTVCAISTTATGPAGAQPCTPIRVESNPSVLPEAWRRALEELVAATSRGGQPWSCAGGAVSLVVDSRTAVGRLTIVDADGAETIREITDPLDLVPTGKALLALPAPEAPAMLAVGSADQHPGNADEAPVSPPLARAESPARGIEPDRDGDTPHPDRVSGSRARRTLVTIAAMTGLRYSGPVPMGWTSGELRASLPLDRWLVGAWGRIDLPLGDPPDAPRHFGMMGYGGGLRAGRTLPTGPIEWSLTFDPSIAAVAMHAHEREPRVAPSVESRADLRHASRASLWLGSSLGATWRLGQTLGATLSIDGEVSPADVAANDPSRLGAPEYRGGLSLGVEARIP